MRCNCGDVPLATIRIERIEQQIAKLRQAITDGLYGERSVVGDAVLAIEGQLSSLREVLDVKIQFNDTHPELRPGEVFLCNVVPRTLEWRNIPYKTKRLGNQAYDVGGKAIAFAPVFVQSRELKKK